MKPPRQILRRKAKAATLADIIAHDLDDPHVFVGPAVWRQGSGGWRTNYFMLAMSRRGLGFGCAQVFIARASARTALVAGLKQRPLVLVHDVGDELRMIEQAAARWPSARKLLRAMVQERERAA